MKASSTGDIYRQRPGRVVPEVRVTEMPYVFRNCDEVEHVRRELRPYMTRRFGGRGLYRAGMERDRVCVYLFQKVSITSLEVAQAQKMVVEGGFVEQQHV
ncbi:MAG: hypothetical protein R2874_16835 [Desulfobacterales bacterium]